jgi:hypothetical protein
MPKNNKGYKVGDRIQISLNGRICDGTIKAVIESTSGVRLTVSFGRDQVAVIHPWQVVPEDPQK